jgi:uncharacterized protein (TIGR02246 family)
MILLVLAAAALGCNAKSADTADEAAIRRADANWLAAASTRDLERTLPYWSDDATILAPGTPAVVGKDAIRKYVSGAFATPGFSITWTTDRIEIAKSGDLAYSTGTDRITINGSDGKPVVQENRSAAIWRKQPDGSWKCTVDIMSPAGAPDAK